jgi:hypothetical protein
MAAGCSFFGALIDFSFAQLLTDALDNSNSTVHGGDPPALSAYRDKNKAG